MKRLLLLPLLAILLLSSCSQDIEDNTPALQARVNDSMFFKAQDVRAFYNEQGNLIIRGTRDGEILSFNGMPPFPSMSGLGLGGRWTAAYTDPDGRIFSTANENASGSIRPIVRENTVELRFDFTAIRNNRSVTFSEGIGYEVPISQPIDLSDDQDDTVEDSFTARVNTVSFNPTVIASAIANGNLSISGQTSNASIRLSFPSNTGPGMYDFASTGAFTGVYRVMDTDFISESGTLNVISNDTEDRVIVGEFTFETSDFSVTNGAFTINY